MTKRVLFLVVFSLLFTTIIFAQKPQRTAYIDMAYILENVPDYQEAKSQLGAKVQKWQNKIAIKQREIEILKTDLANEKALLTKDLIEEREEDISIMTEELKKTQNKYFGTKGDLYRLQKQLVKPVQDQVYNAIQDIAKKRKYDFVLDKSSDLIMLYTNDKYDISDLVIKSITRTEKQKQLAEKREKKNKKKARSKTNKKANTSKAPNPETVKRAEEKAANKKVLEERVAKQKDEREKKRAEQKKALEESREKRKQEREEAKKKIADKRAAEKKAREEK